MIGCLFLNKIGVKSAICFTGHSYKTIIEYFKEFCERIEESLSEIDPVIGGAGIFVQIDKCLF